MRVLHVTRDFAPRSVGGVSSAVSGLVKALSDAGVPQAVVSFDAFRVMSAELRPHRVEDVGGVPVLRSETDILQGVIADYARAFAPTVQLVHDSLLFMHTQAFAARALVVHVDAAAQDRLRGVERTMTSDAQRIALAEAERVVVTTSAAAQMLGIPTTVCGLASSLPALPRSGGGPLFAALRFDWLKGIDVLADALPGLLELGPVAIAGGMPESPKTERRWLAKLRGAEILGWLEPPALASALAHARAFIAPSRLETCGLAVIEAAAAEVPLVVSDIAAHREAVPDAETFTHEPASLVAAAARALACPHPSHVPGWAERVHEWLAFLADCR